MRFSGSNELMYRFIAMNISSGIAVGLVNLIVPLFALSMNASSTEIGMIRGMMGVGDLIIVLPAGFLIDYFGSRKMYTLACIFGAFLIVLIAFAGSPVILLLMMVTYGIARSLRTTALSADFFRHMTEIGIEKGGWFKGSSTIGYAFIGPLLGGLLVIFLGYPECFLITAAILIVPVLILHSWGIETKGNEPVMSRGRDAAELREGFQYYRELLRNRVFVSATITDAFNGTFYNVFITFITVLAVHDFGWSPEIAAILIALRGVAQVLVVIFCGRLLYGNHNTLYIASFVMLIGGIVLLGVSSNVLVLGLASIIIGAFSGLLTLITFTNIGTIEGEKGKIAGMSSFAGCFGTILGPLFGGIIADIWGTQMMFLAFIPFFGAIALYYAIDKPGSPAAIG